LLLVIVLGYFSLYGFSRGVRKKIKKDAEGSCQHCNEEVGYINLIASHIDHSKNEKYNEPANGIALCVACEAHYHGKHIGMAWKIGLSEVNNEDAAVGQIEVLKAKDPELADYLYDLYFKSRRRKKR
jgi:hypothetical protein